VIRWISESSRWPRTVTPGESRGSRNHDDSAGSGSALSGVRLPADEPGCSAVTGARPRGFRRMMGPVFVWCLEQRGRVSHRFRTIRLRSFKVRNPQHVVLDSSTRNFAGPFSLGKGFLMDSEVSSATRVAKRIKKTDFAGVSSIAQLVGVLLAVGIWYYGYQDSTSPLKPPWQWGCPHHLADSHRGQDGDPPRLRPVRQLTDKQSREDLSDLPCSL